MTEAYMTEAEWLTCDDPNRMLEFLWGKASDRKARLFACACCRDQWGRFPPENDERRALEVCELYADGLVAPQDFSLTEERAPIWVRMALWATPFNAAQATANRMASRVRETATDPYVFVERDGRTEVHVSPEGKLLAAPVYVRQCGFLRDIFCNPLRPIDADPRWLTSTVRDLAHAIYDYRAYDCFPILADALEDAGSDNADVLAHCRSDGPHVKGCWVVDMVLGKH